MTDQDKNKIDPMNIFIHLSNLDSDVGILENRFKSLVKICPELQAVAEEVTNAREHLQSALQHIEITLSDNS